MIVLVLKFLLAHILGDFVFQSSRWVQHKRRYKVKSTKLYLHLLIHAIFLIVVFQFDFSYWKGFTIILVSHYVIDLGKLYANDRFNNITLFFIDQLLHLFIIFGVVYLYQPEIMSSIELFTPNILLLTIAILLVTNVTSIVMRVLISKWKPEENNHESLQNAGAYIGMLERLFIFGFIILDYWEGIGFLLAAKSVFRFGDLSNAKDRKLTEYILIGTLFSFGLAMLIGLGYQYIQTMI
ncbi:DUF3307 domain-containing protein [Brumimicrobium aurantiacum]|uniref:DUF3307 domain-containing protein n=1 Tax=Brumimicrobium aurantiacum TaxID=1737063 RepID=A0A3E1F0J5_9FLAO|nr:DUF3307 domain-containing protein [Brumimicrobium aurantiacum]RFC55237.1 DUF3307 domain-containing protein [Brumimicrobium aurantiacum]